MTDWSSGVQEFINEVATSVAIVERDWEGKIVVSACNEGFFQMTGGRTAVARRFPVPFDAMVPRYAWRELREKVNECFTSCCAQELDQAYDLKDGTHWWRLSLNPLRHKFGDAATVDILLTGLDVTPKMELAPQLEISTSRFRSADRIRLMDLLQKEADTDELTGPPNRRTFFETAATLFRSSEKVSLFMLDIDHFKKVNDTYGHDAGDEVLRALADAGKTDSRERDIFARIGGEEFVALLPETDLEEAREIAEKLRTALEHQDFVHSWRVPPIPFTVSIGVAMRAPGEDHLEEVLKRADEALYKAKESGRNRVVCGSQSTA